MGSIIASAVILLIIAIFMIVGAVKGFLGQIFGFIGGLAALILAIILCRPVANIIFSNTTWMDGLALKIADVFNLPDTEVEAQNLTAALTEMNYPGFMQDSIVKLAESMNEATVNLSIVISQTIAKFIIIALCFIALFILIRLGVLLLKGLSKALTQLPVIGTVDKILGLVLGFLKGLLLVYVLMFLLSIIPLEFLDVARTAVAESPVATFFAKYNLLAMLLAWLATI